MPYGISQQQTDCAGWATVKRETDGSYTTIGCHETKQDAIDQMIVVSMSEDIEPLGEIRQEDETDMTDQTTRALASGDFVSWDSSGGRARGRIIRIVTGGDLNIPDSSFTITGTEDDPAALIRLYQETDDGWTATDTLVGHKLSTLTPIADLRASAMKATRNDEFIAAIDAVMAILTQVKSSYESEETDEEDEEDDEDEIDESEQMTGDEYRAVDLSAPEFMRESARRGLRLHEQGLSGDGLMPATVADARRMADGEISEAKWRKIPAWIARHIGDLSAVEGDEITAGLVAMLLWGGGSTRESAERAQAYGERIIKQLDDEQTRCADSSASDKITAMSIERADREHRWCITGADERRVAYTTLEMREIGDGNTLVGYAAVFDSPSEPMPFTEYVKRGAFTKTIKDGADVRLLIDHEGVPLARTKSGTLTLEEDERGLKVSADLDPANPDAARVISAMRRGDLSQMSFAFRTIKDSWSDDRTVRELKEVQLFDVSVVTFPAYEQTMAELRELKTDANLTPTTDISVRKAQIMLARHR